MKSSTFSTIILFSIFYFLNSHPVWAAILHLDPAQNSYYKNDTFSIKIRIDAQGECINAVEASLSFPADILEVADISKGSSIVTFWTKEPAVTNKSGKEGVISFVGGMPGGYCGRIAGDPGQSDLLFRVFFRANPLYSLEKQTEVEINFLQEAKVLLNDGFGTPATVELSGAKALLLPELSQQVQDVWQEELKKDIIPPEPFSVKVARDPLTFEGKWFAVFNAIDNQTGIAYYEIKEGRGSWKETKSPYLLQDQSLRSLIQIRAVDKAGNERIAEYIPAKKTTLSKTWWLFWLTFGAMAMFLLGIIIRKRYNAAKKI